MDGQLKI
jgi:hypothetical protein